MLFENANPENPACARSQESGCIFAGSSVGFFRDAEIPFQRGTNAAAFTASRALPVFVLYRSDFYSNDVVVFTEFIQKTIKIFDRLEMEAQCFGEASLCDIFYENDNNI